jgi:hypothetical protein
MTAYRPAMPSVPVHGAQLGLEQLRGPEVGRRVGRCWLFPQPSWSYITQARPVRGDQVAIGSQ